MPIFGYDLATRSCTSLNHFGFNGHKVHTVDIHQLHDYCIMYTIYFPVVLTHLLQNMPCNLEQWIDGNLLLSDYLTTGEDKLNSSLFEFVILFARSLREELMNNVIVEYGTAILTCRYVS